ncbi:MAG: DNA repair protein RecO [Candidatus Pelagibacter sp.]
MNWTDTGILLSKNKFQENSTIVNFYTKNHGKCSGIIFGASSKKIKNYLQIGNELHLNYNSKSDDSFGYFKVEILKVYTPIFFSKKKTMYCINSALNLVNLLTVDNQVNILIYNLVHKLFTILEKENWYINYVFWELDFLRLIGFDLDVKKYAKKESNGKNEFFITTNLKKIKVPNFLISKKEDNVNNQDIIDGLNLISEYLQTNLFLPNNINFPHQRKKFIDDFKS